MAEPITPLPLTSSRADQIFPTLLSPSPFEPGSFVDRTSARAWRAAFFSSGACLRLVMSLALLPACAWPQTEVATVFGTVTDPSGAVIPGAQVTIGNQSTGLKRDSFTDSTGQYHIAGLPMGKYSVRVQKEGFQTQVREGITLTSAYSLTMNFSLAVGINPQELTVSGDVNEIDSITSVVTGLVPEQSLAELPLNSRDLFKASIFAHGVAPTPSSAPSVLSKGTTGQVAINGMRPSWTDVRMDDMDANDPVFGYSPAGASGLFLGLNEFAEVRVLTQTFDVEYGRNGGGVIDAGLQPILWVKGLNAQGNQLPSGYAHLCRERFKRLLAKVATPNLDRSPIRPSQADSTVFSRGAEESYNPRATVCTSLALLHKYIFLIYADLQPHLGPLPLS